MRRLIWGELSQTARVEALARPKRRLDRQIAEVVRRIFDEVEQEGAGAVERWALKLDNRAPQRLELTRRAVDEARAMLAPDDLAALEMAVENVRRFHVATKPAEAEVEISPGVRCRRLWRPIASCGLYAPAGSAPLFSTLIMLAEPARVAGVPVRIAVTPPAAAPHPIMAAAAAACGLEALWLIGGAQAIAALTFGAVTPKAQKIFGPGNVYVAEAKRYAASLPDGPQIDVPAGPSELMVVADASANAAVVAADLLSQAEHDPDAQVLLVSDSPAMIELIAREVRIQALSLPRVDIVQAALSHASTILVRSLDEAADIANAYAPEHLALQVETPERLLERVDNAGAVFVGAWSAETFGDYACGPSHVLPTDGASRVWSGVGVASFMRSFVVQEMNETGARALASPAARLARLEGLEAHARAADARVR